MANRRIDPVKLSTTRKDIDIQSKPILLHGHTRALTKVIYNPEGDLLFSVSKDTVPNVWFTHNGELLGSFLGHNGSVWSLSVSNDSSQLLTGSGDNTAKLWDTQTGREKESLSTLTAVRAVAFSDSTNKYVLIVTDAKMGHPAKWMIYSTKELGDKNAKPIQEVTIKGSKITTANWSLDNKFIYTGHEDGSIIQWDPKTGAQIKSIKEHTGAISDFQFSLDKTHFITASKDHTAKIFDASNLNFLKVYKTERPVNGAAISPIRDEVILGGGQEAMSVTTTSSRAGKFEVRFFDLVYEEEVGRVKGHFGPINTVAYAPNGQGFASGAEDGYVRLHQFDPEYYSFSLQ